MAGHRDLPAGGHQVETVAVMEYERPPGGPPGGYGLRIRSPGSDPIVCAQSSAISDGLPDKWSLSLDVRRPIDVQKRSEFALDVSVFGGAPWWRPAAPFRRG